LAGRHVKHFGSGVNDLIGSQEREVKSHEFDDRAQANHRRPHAEALGCAEQLETVSRLAEKTGARRQLELSRSLGSLPRVVAVLADDFLA